MRRLFLSFLFAVIATVATAAPVRFMPVTLVQPQGDTVYCYVSGDEFFHRLHDADGYTIIRHPSTGQYVYASLAEGDLVPTSFVVGRDDPKTSGLEPNLIPDAKHLKRFPVREYLRLFLDFFARKPLFCIRDCFAQHIINELLPLFKTSRFHKVIRELFTTRDYSYNIA